MHRSIMWIGILLLLEFIWMLCWVIL
uniref:Uncharacterized protein n=1 Tax=Rhizophora mucronata TaxID=61149 RepID=A0A2P2N6S1_RHIMU